MNTLDRWLQRLRIRQALPWIPADAHLLDVGCADGALFSVARGRVRSGVGVDLVGTEQWPEGPYDRRSGRFPDVVGEETFDAVTMLAVVEHVPEDELKEWAAALPALLREQGRLIITTPAPLVDHLLHVAIRLRILDGMEAEQHHGFDPDDVPRIFTSMGLRLVHRARFELGLNHVFVFERVAGG